MLRELLINKKSSIVKNWTQLIFETYSKESTRFFELEKNQFSNPVGYTISNNIEKIFDELVGDNNFDRLRSLLSEIIKMRAIQDFSPSQAVEFIYQLKKVMRSELEMDINKENVINEYLEFESKIDRAALIAFDLYMEYREKVYQIRVNQIKSNSFTE